MSLYNFYYHINPDYKKILLEIGVYGRSLPKFEGEDNLDLVYISRMRDVFYKNGVVHLLTRMGGGNRKTYQKEIDKLRNIYSFIRDFDCEFCSTYAVFLFDKQIDTPEYFREGYSKLNELVHREDELTLKAMDVVAKMINREKLTLEEMFLTPHNVIIKNKSLGYDKIIAPIDREDIINVIKWQTDPEYVWDRYKRGKLKIIK